MVEDEKRSNGQYFTEGNPFKYDQFWVWANLSDVDKKEVLEPFAGSNNLIDYLSELDFVNKFASYDISPADPEVKKRDTIEDFPTGYDVCVTNPPWLAKNSAKRRGLPFPDTEYDDLYKHCLSLCLENCKYVAAIVPASFLKANIFRKRLFSFTFMYEKMFKDTDNPVGLALFVPSNLKNTIIYNENDFVGSIVGLDVHIPNPIHDKKVRFNDPEGKLGLIAIDNTDKPSIRFCRAEEIMEYEVKPSSRNRVRISGDFKDLHGLIMRLNIEVQKFRDSTKDVFLTPFKGIRKDGFYRRRMDFDLARKFINSV